MTRNVPALFLLTVLTAVIMPLSAYSGEITVKHGKFDHFNISMPEKAVAGADAEIKLSAMDSLNNPVTSFGEPKRNFMISVTGSAAVRPSSFDSSALTNGGLTITLSDKTAEAVTFSVTESDSPVPILTREFSVIPNKLSSLVVKGPRSVAAGERFEVKIIAKDVFGNTVPEPVFGKNLNISFAGSAEPKIETPLVTEFRNGAGTVAFIAERAGTVSIEIKDMATGSSGSSEKISIKNGPLHSFKILHPREVIAGEPFDFTIIPVDRFGNVLANYSSTGSGVAITSSGKQKPFPSNIPANEFAGGQVKAVLRYDGAETVKIRVTELGTNQTVESESMVFVPPTAERFEIVTPDSVIAGQKFKIKVIAYNQLSHVFKNYNLTGSDVLLSTTGTGNLMPNRVPPSEFLNGVAIVDVQYNKSESFEIVASEDKANEAAREGRDAVSASVAAIKQKKSKAGEIKAAETKAASEIKNISVVEGRDKANIEVQVENISMGWRYKVDTMTRDGNKWIVLRIMPAVNKIENMPKIESLFVSDILVEKDEKGKDSALVKIKLSRPARYHISKKNNSLNIELKR